MHENCYNCALRHFVCMIGTLFRFSRNTNTLKNFTFVIIFVSNNVSYDQRFHYILLRHYTTVFLLVKSYFYFAYKNSPNYHYTFSQHIYTLKVQTHVFVLIHIYKQIKKSNFQLLMTPLIIQSFTDITLKNKIHYVKFLILGKLAN